MMGRGPAGRGKKRGVRDTCNAGSGRMPRIFGCYVWIPPCVHMRRGPENLGKAPLCIGVILTPPHSEVEGERPKLAWPPTNPTNYTVQTRPVSWCGLHLLSGMVIRY